MNRIRRASQRGSAMLVTLIIVAALLAGGTVLVSMQMSSNRATEVTSTGTTALYCAEAGIAAARPLIAANYKNWNANLGTNIEPAFLAGISHDIDSDSVNDFVITMRDNDDELLTANNPAVDQDLQVFVTSTCIKYPETPKVVVELLRFTGTGNCYNAQQGGNAGNGNDNGCI